jgi:hypothetical protein
MEEYNKGDDRPAFHKMGFDDVEDQAVWISLKKYSKMYRTYTAREKMGGSKNIHMPETEHNPPTPFL